MKKKKPAKNHLRRTVADAINVLLQKADAYSTSHPERTKRYVQMAWGLVKKYKIRLTKEQKGRFCRKCGTFFIVGKTAQASFNARTNAFYINCAACGHMRRL